MPSELITYRGVSMLLNTISAMNVLLEHELKWDYFINLSGADYPLIESSNIRLILGTNKHMNFFSFADRVSWKAMAENRLSQLWFDDALSFSNKANDKDKIKESLIEILSGRNPFIDRYKLEICHAEAWMISSRKFCEYVIKSDTTRKLLVSFSYAVGSSEHYFATLAWNVPEFKSTIVSHSMRKIMWTYNGVMAGQHPYLIDEQFTSKDESIHGDGTKRMDLSKTVSKNLDKKLKFINLNQI